MSSIPQSDFVSWIAGLQHSGIAAQNELRVTVQTASEATLHWSLGHRRRSPDLLLALRFDQFQHPEFLLRDICQRYRQPDALRIENAEAPTHESAIRRVHRLFEEILGAAWPMADVDGFPIRAAAGATTQLSLRRVSATAATEDTVGALFLGSAQPALVQHRPD
jgi:hypothetical protein